MYYLFTPFLNNAALYLSNYSSFHQDKLGLDITMITSKFIFLTQNPHLTFGWFPSQISWKEIAIKITNENVI